MERSKRENVRSDARRAGAVIFGVLALAGCSSSTTSDGGVVQTGIPGGPATMEQIAEGRAQVVSSSCTDCHNRGKDDPTDPNWLAGYLPGTPGQPFNIGPFLTYPANLTPDETGLARFTDRQVYNALSFGLTPETAPDAEITSTTPGMGNFPAMPHYLAPPMPWPAFRHKTDAERWAIVAYLKHGIKAVVNMVPDGGSPPDFWAGAYAPANIGPSVLPAYPTASEEFKP